MKSLPFVLLLLLLMTPITLADAASQGHVQAGHSDDYEGCPQMLSNPSFETLPSRWVVTNGTPKRTTVLAHTGQYSTALGGYPNASDGIAQLMIEVPQSADTAALSFWWQMRPFEAVPSGSAYLVVNLDYFLGYGAYSVAEKRIYDYDLQGQWYQVQLPAINLAPYRGQRMGVSVAVISSITDTPLWFVDDFELRFCGALATPTVTAPEPTATQLPATPPPPPPGDALQVPYKSGWNIVAGPGGITFGQANRMLYTSQGNGGYDVLLNSQGVTEGWGYWAYFPSDTSVNFSGTGSTSYSTSVSAGEMKMVGNPSGTKNATVTADKIYTYDPVTGYSISFGSATLPVGSGAWVYSAGGGTVTVEVQWENA